MRWLGAIVLGAMLAVGWAGSAAAAVTVYTSSTAFLSAVGAGPVLTQDFESFDPNDILASGTTLDGVTFQFPGTLSGRIDRRYQSLGEVGLGLQRRGTDYFVSGERLRLSFDRELSAFGIIFNVDRAPRGSLIVDTAVGDAANGSARDPANPAFFFVGLVSDTPFDEVVIRSSAAADGYTVDNIMHVPFHVTPVPATGLLLATAVGALGAWRRRARA